MPTSLLFCRRLPLPSLLLPIFFCNQSKVGEAFLQKEVAGNEFKMLMPPFLHFFSPASNPIEHQEEANHVVVTTKWHLAQKCIYPNIKVLPASKGFTAQLAIINNACFCSSIVHRDDVMFKKQSNINLPFFFYFDAPLSPHSFPQLGQCFRIEIRTMPFMPIFAASIDTGNCMLFSGIESPIVTLLRTYVH